ncbi:hypothetical protein JHK82_025189 [Glycine max]|nr:hypothetical protein JHK82_025189 [Glycine max]
MKRFLLRLTGEVLTSIAKDRLVTWDGSVNMREIMARLSDTPMLWISRWFMKRKVLFIGDGALCWRRPVSQIREAWMFPLEPWDRIPEYAKDLIRECSAQTLLSKAHCPGDLTLELREHFGQAG